jgi:hypothetical protein
MRAAEFSRRRNRFPFERGNHGGGTQHGASILAAGAERAKEKDRHFLARTLLAVGLISASAVYGINAAVRTAKNKRRQHETSGDELFAQLSNEQLTWS